MSSTDTHHDADELQESPKSLEVSYAEEETQQHNNTELTTAPESVMPSIEAANEFLKSPEITKSLEATDKDLLQQSGIVTDPEQTFTLSLTAVDTSNKASNYPESSASFQDSAKEETPVLPIPALTEALNEQMKSLESAKEDKDSIERLAERKDDTTVSKTTPLPNMSLVEAQNKSLKPVMFLKESSETKEKEPNESLKVAKSLEDSKSKTERKENASETMVSANKPTETPLSNESLEVANSLEQSVQDLEYIYAIMAQDMSTKSEKPLRNSKIHEKPLDSANIYGKPDKLAPEPFVCAIKKNVTRPESLQESSNCPLYSFVTKTEQSPSVDPVAKRFDNFNKLRGDNKEYRGLELTNRLKVLLIRDPKADKAAVCLDVNVGHLSDPDQLPGLAHFCELMLFLGSEKYPEKEKYSTYLSEHEGSSESSTLSDHTSFYFDVSTTHLDKTLDIFAHFFISPLFTESEAGTVLETIQSEYEDDMQNDDARLAQLEKSTSLHTHPFHNFAAGNRETLETIPKSQNIDVRKELLNFYYKWYSANIMTLVVLGKQSLDELENMVSYRFSRIEDKLVIRPTWQCPFSSELLRKRVYCEPTENTNMMVLVFPLPDLTENYKTSPWGYIMYLLNNQGPGSVYDVVYSNNWCDSLEVDIDTYHGYSLFRLVMVLTEVGLSFIDDIILLVFQYLALLKTKGPKRWVFEELSHLQSFSYSRTAQELVTSLVHLLQDIPMEDVLTEGVRMMEWDPKLIMDQIGLLTPDNMRITVVAKAFSTKCTLTESWYGTKYFEEDINESLIMKWNNAKPTEKLQMPAPNEFLPTDFSFVQVDETSKDVDPVIIEDSTLMRVWYKHDTQLQEPDGYIHLDICSPLINSHPVNSVLNYLWVMLLWEQIQQYSSAAELAGLSWDLLDCNGGITITVEGLSDKIHRLLNKIVDHVINFNVDPKRFKVMKKILTDEFLNANQRPLHKIAETHLRSCLIDSKWTTKQCLLALSVLKPKLLDVFVSRVLTYFYIQAFVYGNFTKDRALEITENVGKKFSQSRCPVFAKELLLARDVELEKGAWYVREIKNDVHKSSCASLYYECGLKNSEEHVMLRLLICTMKKPCQDILITKEGSNHKVLTQYRLNNSTQGVLLTVEGDNHPRILDHQIETFLQQFLEHLENMSEEEFVKRKKTLTDELLGKLKTISDRAMQLSSEIVNQVYNFNRPRLEAEQLKSITKEDLIQFYKKYVVKDAPERRKISMYVVSIAEKDKNTEINTHEDDLYEAILTPTEQNISIDEFAPRVKLPIQILLRKDNDKMDSIDEICESELIADQKPTKITDVLEFQNKLRLHPRPKPFIEVPKKAF